MQDVATIRAKFEAVRPYLDERRRRLWAAAEAMALGHGGAKGGGAAPRAGRRPRRGRGKEVQRALNYSLQATRTTKEGSDHPDRDAQFAYLNEQTRAFQQRGQPVISVDCKQKELVGDFANGGREGQPAGYPEVVRVHDFLD